jgi:hypothetical protein
MAFWACRERIFSEDTYWDEFSDRSPSTAIRALPYRIPFLEKNVRDPVTAYAANLIMYRGRDLNITGNKQPDARNAFLGILNRILYNCHTTPLYAMPKSQFDMALIWWHRPDMNTERNIQRNVISPSWSWVGWMGGMQVQFSPGHSFRDNQKWLQRYSGRTYYWWADIGSNNLTPVWDRANQLRLQQNDPGHGRNIPNRATPVAMFSGDPSRSFLQFRGTKVTGFGLRFQLYGIGEIRDMNNELAGIVYADEQRANSSNSYEFILLTKAKNPKNFDVGNWLPTLAPLQYNRGLQEMQTRAGMAAKNHRVYWVMMVELTTRNFYERKGMGWITQRSLNNLGTSYSTIVLG